MTDYKWDGEVHVSYKMDVTPVRFQESVTGANSPLEIVTEMLEDVFLLKHKKHDFGQPIVCGEFDPEEKIGSHLVKSAARRLRFEPTYEVGQEWDYALPQTMEIYRDLTKILESASIPYFILVEDEGPETMFVAGGSNVQKGLRIVNERPDLFPL